MFPTSAAVSQTIKVSFGDETRRLTIDLVAGASSATALAAIQKGVKRSFCLSDAEDLVLKYLDDEGDLCTLADLCLEDLAANAKAKPWKIQASLGAQSPASVVARASASTPSQACGADASSVAGLEGDPACCPRVRSEGARPSADFQHAENIDETMMPPEWKEISAAMAFPMLPCVAKAAQLEFVRVALSMVGVEQRKRVVEWCCEVLQHLDLVPEAVALRPKLEAFVDGSDPEHFGDVLAELLKAWASSSSPELVRDTVAMHHQGFRAIMKQTFKALRKCKGEWKGKGMGKCGWWMGKGDVGHGECDGCAGKGGKGGKGKGKCEGGMSKGEWLHCKGESLQCKGERLKSKGEWLKAKAMGKGKWDKSPEEWAEHLDGMPWLCSFGGGLARVFAQKGLGKGKGFCARGPSSTPPGGPASAPAAPAAACGAATTTDPLAGVPIPTGVDATLASKTMESDVVDGIPATESASTAAQFVAAPDVAESGISQAAAPEGVLSSKVQLLLEMGLVSDRGIGLDLLRAQGGDITQVVALLTG